MGRLSLQSPSLFLSYFLTTGDVSIGIKCAPGVVGPTEADIDFDIIRNDNDTFTVKYTPRGAGSYTIMVLFADQVGVIAPSSRLLSVGVLLSSAVFFHHL